MCFLTKNKQNSGSSREPVFLFVVAKKTDVFQIVAIIGVPLPCVCLTFGVVLFFIFFVPNYFRTGTSF